MRTEIDQIFDDLARVTGVTELERTKFFVDQFVIITKGPYEGKIAKIEECEANRVHVWLGELQASAPYDYLRPLPKPGDVVEIKSSGDGDIFGSHPTAGAHIRLEGYLGEVVEVRADGDFVPYSFRVELSVGTFDFDPKNVCLYEGLER